MQLITLIAACVAGSAGPQEASAQGPGTLELRVTPPIEVGALRVALHASTESFSGGGPPAAGGIFVPGQDVVIEGLPPGSYGLLVHHDVDADGVLDTNFLGIPDEPVGFAGSYRPTGRPDFERTQVVIAAGQRTVERVVVARPLEKGAFGVGVGAVVQGLPYRGASSARVQPIPVATYVQGDLAVLGPQLLYRLGERGPLTVSGSLRARFGAYAEDDADILQGLGDRDLVALGGVRLDLALDEQSTFRLTYEHDLFDTVGGGEATASVLRRFQTGDVTWAPSIGVRWTAADLVTHDFGVEGRFALPGRPAYTAGDALYLEVGLSTRAQLTDNLQFLLNVNGQLFDDEVEDSPIVEDGQRVSAVLGLVWTL